MQYANGTASAQIKTGVGRVAGVIVNSHSSGTFRLNDGESGTTSAGVKATQTLTTTGTFSNGEEILIGDVTYTMVTALSGAKNEVLIGASAAASLDNLKQAINQGDTQGGGEGEGTNYGNGTVPNPKVTATTNANDSQIVEARRVGTDGNSIATTTDAANASWGDTTLESGAEPSPLLTNTFTVATGSQVVTFPEPVNFVRGLYITVGGTIDYTVVYE